MARLPLVAAVVVAATSLLPGPASAGEGRRPATPSSTTTTVPAIDVAHDGDTAGAHNGPDDVDVDPVDTETASAILRGDAEEAAARRAEVQAALDAIDADITRLQADLRAYRELVDDLVLEQREVARDAIAARQDLMQAAVGAYVSGQRPMPDASYGSAHPNEMEERATLVNTVLEADQAEADALLARRLEVTATLSRILEQAEAARTELASDRQSRVEAEARLEAADFALQVFEAGSEIVITGFVFPVADPHTFSSTFGAPRSGGRSHQGADIFAPMGTPLFATERGVLTNIGTGTLGGIKLWLVGESGTEYYYAHLSSYVEGIRDGMVVEAGDIVGYVGNTGNAISTPPHLHFEIHPEGGDAIDPYPLLHTVDQLDGERVARPHLPEDPRP
jgi:murein DD-endopeptidase MepM/ murein hydrolase activator NlpD